MKNIELGLVRYRMHHLGDKFVASAFLAERMVPWIDEKTGAYHGARFENVFLYDGSKSMMDFGAVRTRLASCVMPINKPYLEEEKTRTQIFLGSEIFKRVRLQNFECGISTHPSLTDFDIYCALTRYYYSDKEFEGRVVQYMQMLEGKYKSAEALQFDLILRIFQNRSDLAFKFNDKPIYKNSRILPIKY